MDAAERERRIIESLRIRPLNHGQVHTFQVAIPAADNQELSEERYSKLESIYSIYKSNLSSIVIRPTDKYSEDEEFEVVYGADWCIAAKKLNIEKLWAWVFNIPDEQLESTKVDLQKLLGVSAPAETEASVPDPINSVDRKLFEQLEKKFSSKIDELSCTLSSKIDSLNQKANGDTTETSLNAKVDELNRTLSDKLDNLNQKIAPKSFKILLQEEVDLKSADKASKQELIKTLQEALDKLKKIDLNLTDANELISALKKVGASVPQAEGAWNAVKFWKSKGELSWNNLEKSSKAKTGNKIKITGFASVGYQKLLLVAIIGQSLKD